MEVLFFLVPAAILMAAGFVFAFYLAVKDGQFDDLDADALRFLGED